VYCKAEQLNEDGMVTDFTHIKRIVKEKFDHVYINEVLDVNPSSENTARWICDHVENCYKVSVQESEGNIATYEK
jgi:6-pyruvoyltetrahydropterin/6-carboxytetrahydropterin synthase